MKKSSAIKVSAAMLRKWPLPDPLQSESKEDRGRVRVVCRSTDAMLVGPGMEDSATTGRVAASLLRATSATTVLDAGALRAYGGRRTANVILTPHLGEMASITGMSTKKLGEQPVEVAMEFAQVNGVTLVLKGRTTCIASADGRAWLHAGRCCSRVRSRERSRGYSDGCRYKVMIF